MPERQRRTMRIRQCWMPMVMRLGPRWGCDLKVIRPQQ
jgi:hypothetical protein